MIHLQDSRLRCLDRSSSVISPFPKQGIVPAAASHPMSGQPILALEAAHVILASPHRRGLHSFCMPILMFVGKTQGIDTGFRGRLPNSDRTEASRLIATCAGTKTCM